MASILTTMTHMRMTTAHMLTTVPILFVLMALTQRAVSRVLQDALVDSGRAALDHAPITGESLRIDKPVGDPLYAGTIVTDGVVKATVTVVAGGSTLARIAAAIQDAQSQRAPTQRFVDQFARYYTPAVVVLALLVAVLGSFFIGAAWGEWLYQALVLLVIA